VVNLRNQRHTVTNIMHARLARTFTSKVTFY